MSRHRYQNDVVRFFPALPSGWREERIHNVAELRTSNVDKKSEEGEKAVRLCNYVDVYKNDKVTMALDFMEATATEAQIDRFGLRVGDVVITKDSETPDDIGVPALIAETADDLVCGYHLTIMRPNENEVMGDYLFYAVASRLSAYQFYLAANGVTRFGLTYHGTKNLRIALPSVSEQQQIAAFLDWKTGQIDALIARKLELLEKLKEKRLAVITQAVTRGLNPAAPLRDSGIPWLGHVPEHWEVKRLKFQTDDAKGAGIQIGPFGGMLTDLIYAETGEFKLYGQENVLSGDFSKGNRWLTSDQYAELSQYGAREGDFLFTRKGSIGGCAIFPDGAHPGIIDSDTIRLRVNSEGLSTRFLLHAFRESEYLQFQVQLIKRGAILSGLNTTTIADLVLAAPPLDEQVEIAHQLDVATSKLKRLASKVESAIARLTEYRSALITAATTGKIDVRGVKIPKGEEPGIAPASQEA